jgi:hypothetical protein
MKLADIAIKNEVPPSDLVASPAGLKVPNKTFSETISINPNDNPVTEALVEPVPDYCNQALEKRSITSYTEKMIEARKWELRGFEQLLRKNWECAELAFQNAYDIWPIYHSVKEILDFLKEQKSQPRRGDRNSLPDDPVCKLYRKITQEFSWGMPQDVREELKSRLLKCN